MFVTSVYFSNKIGLTLETHFDKSKSISGSNNLGVCWRSPSRQRSSGVRF